MNTSKLKSLMLIHIALIIGQVIFAVIAVVLNGSTVINLQPENDLFFFIIPAFALTSMLAGNLVFKKLLENAKNQSSEELKLNGYRSAMIVRYALTEAASLFAIVVYFLQGNLFYILIAGFVIVYFITIRPTQGKAEFDLDLKL